MKYKTRRKVSSGRESNDQAGTIGKLRKLTSSLFPFFFYATLNKTSKTEI